MAVNSNVASSGGSNIRQGLAKALDWIPNWVGFTLILAAGVLMLVVGAAQSKGGFIAFGLATIISGIIAWVDGAKSRPKLTFNPKTFGGTVSNIDQAAWIAIFGLFVIALIIALVVG